MPVRLKDIAKDVGVSTVTVSKVLRGAKDVGREMRQKILQRMRELDYQPNMMARALANGRTNSVGLVVPDLVNPFFAEFAKSLSVSLRGSGRALLVASSEEEPELERQEIRTLLRRGVDVMLLASCETKMHCFSAPQELNAKAARTPFILFDRKFSQTPSHFVGSDDFMAGEIATRHFIEIGRKRIAHLGTRRFSTGRDRLRGYRAVMNGEHLTVPETYVILKERFEETGDRSGYNSMQKLLRLKKRPNAVFCYNDLMAIGAIRATIEAGLRIPQDIAFVGCGNFRYANYLEVPLTSIDHSTETMGHAAGELTLSVMQNPDQPARVIVIDPKLMVRASTCASPR